MKLDVRLKNKILHCFKRRHCEKLCCERTSQFYICVILGDPGADSGGEGKSKRAEKCGTEKSKERREELFSLFFTFLRSIYIFPPV